MQCGYREVGNRWNYRKDYCHGGWWWFMWPSAWGSDWRWDSSCNQYITDYSRYWGWHRRRQKHQNLYFTGLTNGTDTLLDVSFPVDKAGEHVVTDHWITPVSSVRKATYTITELELTVAELVVVENLLRHQAVTCTGTVADARSHISSSILGGVNIHIGNDGNARCAENGQVM